MLIESILEKEFRSEEGRFSYCLHLYNLSFKILRYCISTSKYAKIQILVTGCVGEDMEKKTLST